MSKDRDGHGCIDCSTFVYDQKERKLKCNHREGDRCFDISANKYKFWDLEKESDMSIEKKACLIAIEAFNSAKAKFFNILESQIENTQKLWATKRIAEEIIGSITNDIRDSIIKLSK